MIKRALQLVLIAGLAGTVTGAAKAEKTVTGGGLGTSSCVTWTAERNKVGGAAAYEQWFLGYLTGTAVWAAEKLELDPLRGTEAANIWAWVDSYCEDHPFELITRVGDAFVAAHPR